MKISHGFLKEIGLKGQQPIVSDQLSQPVILADVFWQISTDKAGKRNIEGCLALPNDM